MQQKLMHTGLAENYRPDGGLGAVVHCFLRQERVRDLSVSADRARPLQQCGTGGRWSCRTAKTNPGLEESKQWKLQKILILLVHEMSEKVLDQEADWHRRTEQLAVKQAFS